MRQIKRLLSFVRPPVWMAGFFLLFYQSSFAQSIPPSSVSVNTVATDALQLHKYVLETDFQIFKSSVATPKINEADASTAAAIASAQSAYANAAIANARVGEKGDKGTNGTNGRNGRDGANGRDYGGSTIINYVYVVQ